MNSESYQITKLEMTITLISMIIGVGILTLPRVLANVVGTPDGWISLIIGAVLNMIIVFLIVHLHRQFSGKTFIGFFGDKHFGKWIGKLFSIIFLLYFLALTAYEARILLVVVKIYLLDRTPSEVVAILILLTTTFAVTKGVQGIIHLNLMFFPIVMFIIFLIIIFNIPQANVDEILPILSEGLTPIFMGVSETALAFLGIEILFFFLAYVKSQDLKATTLNMGIGFIGFLYVSITLLCFTVLGFNSTETITFPFVALAKEVEIIEGVVERIEPFMIAVWIMSIFNTMAIIHFLASKIVKDEMLKKVRLSSIAIYLSGIIFILIFIPNSVQETFLFGDYISYLGFGLTCLSLVTGYLLLFFRKKVLKKDKSEAV
ncbi:spore gernimation protein [Anaerobacillus alkaliphilus]|uniref:Spore gernimation protein n=1 Tax=Anaerobacillus alkaliphilus TaxID=1548597 RepID=A0A4Q0VRA1_9BACI|nr:GerAB/ArcD/ProY family transporter [Anaerobacillus alkaliphilus]RXI99899.1 spore gernimation protein [Anaerobacillus alkaliphilus]